MEQLSASIKNNTADAGQFLAKTTSDAMQGVNQTTHTVTEQIEQRAKAAAEQLGGTLSPGDRPRCPR